MRLAESLAEQVDYARKWTQGLIADLSGDDWTFQPQPGVQHPLWICGHLVFAQNALVFQRCLRQEGGLDDAFASHFGIGKPVLSAAEHDYPTPEDVVARMADFHRRTTEAIRSMSDDLLAEAAYAADGTSEHPQYRNKAGAVAHVARHEAFHAGQLAMLRRLLGKTFLR